METLTGPRIIRVEVTERPADEFSPAGISVFPVWEADVPLDRPSPSGFGLRATDRKLAERLVAAIEAGVVYTDAEVKTDIYGQTYVCADAQVMGRYLNTDLKRLGF